MLSLSSHKPYFFFSEDGTSFTIIIQSHFFDCVIEMIEVLYSEKFDR